MNPSDNPSRVEEEYKRLLKARRMAKRTRAVAACIPCKTRKTKCNDSRPCTSCIATRPEACVDGILDGTERSASVYPDSNTLLPNPAESVRIAIQPSYRNTLFDDDESGLKRRVKNTSDLISMPRQEAKLGLQIEQPGPAFGGSQTTCQLILRATSVHKTPRSV